MKKLIVSAILTTALVAGVATAGGCSASTNPDRSVTDNIQTTDDFYSYGAASVGSIISSAKVDSSLSASACKNFMSVEVTGETVTTDESGATDESGTTDGTSENPALPEGENPPAPPAPPARPEVPGANVSNEPSEEQLETINGYMSLIENLLGDGKVSNVQSESDREGYEIKEIVSYSDLEGNTLTYTMYYNRTLISTETETHDKHDHGFEEGFEETESEYSLEGVMIIDGAEYAMEGRYETETSVKGEETEAYFKVVLGEGNYVIMEQESEDDEQSLVYKVVEENRVVEKTKFEYETERNETELKMSVEKNGSVSVIKFSEESLKGVRIINVDALEDGSRISFKIYITQDEDGNDVYRYVYGDQFKDFFKKPYDKHFEMQPDIHR